jgi:hypothetical protein
VARERTCRTGYATITAGLRHAGATSPCSTGAVRSWQYEDGAAVAYNPQNNLHAHTVPDTTADVIVMNNSGARPRPVRVLRVRLHALPRARLWAMMAAKPGRQAADPYAETSPDDHRPLR